MDDALALCSCFRSGFFGFVLILVVMDDALAPDPTKQVGSNGYTS